MTNDWIEKQWENTQFGDPRLNKRVIAMAKSMFEHPGVSLPEQMGSFAATKAAYRFLSNELVDHAVLQGEHYLCTLGQAAQSQTPVLFIQDGSELLFNGCPCTTGLGPTNDSHGNGCLIHTTLVAVYEPCGCTVLGLGKQFVWTRGEGSAAPRPPGTDESGVWEESLRAIGAPPEGAQWICVCDRGADCFAFFDAATALGWDLVVRLAQDRNIAVEGEETKLKNYARGLRSIGKREVTLRARANQSSRTVTLNYAVGSIVLPVPQGAVGSPIPVQIVRIWGEELEWILLTTLPVNSLEDAILIGRYYEHRWIIEDYHKCLKTGFEVEQSQLQMAERIFNLLGIVGIMATQLLLLRDLARSYPDLEAHKVVPPIVVLAINLMRPGVLSEEPTVRELIRCIARIGGFLGRRSDGDPGWITIWRGWRQMNPVIEALENLQLRQKDLCLT